MTALFTLLQPIIGGVLVGMDSLLFCSFRASALTFGFRLFIAIFCSHSQNSLTYLTF